MIIVSLAISNQKEIDPVQRWKYEFCTHNMGCVFVEVVNPTIFEHLDCFEQTFNLKLKRHFFDCRKLHLILIFFFSGIF